MKPSARSYKSITIFENPFLEKFSHIHPLTPLVFWAPFVIYLLWETFTSKQLSFSSILVLVPAGFITWTLVEYLLHRFLFHYEGEGPRSARFHFVVHGFHHEDSQDPTRLVMTPVVSGILGLGFYWLFQAILGPDMAQPFFAFFVIGYLCYDYIHFYVHFFNPKSGYGRFIKQYHMKHHYVGSQSRWGVSSPFWDYVFGTSEEPIETRSERGPESPQFQSGRDSF